MTSHEHYSLGYQPSSLAFVARRTLESHGEFFAPYLRDGMHVLDVGCGPGSITLGIARRVGSGSVIGVDMSDSQVALARQHAAAQRVANVQFQAGSAYALPFPGQSFDAVFSHALLEHLRDPGAAMREFFRVLKPDGLVAVVTPDWGGFLVSPQSEPVYAAVEAFKALQCAAGGDVYVGRKLAQLAVEAGFTAVRQRARYENFEPLSIIGETLASVLERDGQTAHAAALRAWQTTPHGMFSEAWVSCVARRPR